MKKTIVLKVEAMSNDSKMTELEFMNKLYEDLMAMEIRLNESSKMRYHFSIDEEKSTFEKVFGNQFKL